MALRQLKQQIVTVLRQGDGPAALSAVASWPPRKVVSPLFGLLYHEEALVRWRAVAAMGAVTAEIANAEMEPARVIMRRLMWNLNDESGGIGWGSPEAMGEIMARHERLAREYAAILISYLNPHGNFLEHEELQAGLLWGLGRLAHARPAMTEGAASFLPPFLSSPRADLRGLAAWAAGPIIGAALRNLLPPLCADDAEITLFEAGRLVVRTVGDLAAAALGGQAGLALFPLGGELADEG